MEQKQIFFPQEYSDQNGETQRYWRLGGNSFTVFDENSEERYINLYLDALPFNQNIRIYLKAKVDE